MTVSARLCRRPAQIIAIPNGAAASAAAKLLRAEPIGIPVGVVSPRGLPPGAGSYTAPRRFLLA